MVVSLLTFRYLTASKYVCHEVFLMTMLNADRECRALLLTLLTFTNSIVLIIQQIVFKLNR